MVADTTFPRISNRPRLRCGIYCSFRILIQHSSVHSLYIGRTCKTIKTMKVTLPILYHKLYMAIKGIYMKHQFLLQVSNLPQQNMHK